MPGKTNLYIKNQPQNGLWGGRILHKFVVVKLAEKAKEQLLWFEMQFKNIILNQTMEQ